MRKMIHFEISRDITDFWNTCSLLDRTKHILGNSFEITIMRIFRCDSLLHCRFRIGDQILVIQMGTQECFNYGHIIQIILDLMSPEHVNTIRLEAHTLIISHAVPIPNTPYIYI